MSHLIEEYAKSLGVKIGTPVLNDHFYPILDEKYITIHTDNKIDSKNYEYFPQVLNLIKPILNNLGYKIYQIGGPADPVLKNVDKLLLNLSYRQSAYVIKNSKLHLGIDSLPVHMASMYDIPIVALYSHIMANNAYPYWSSKEKIILLESDKKGNKPSYSYEENPKTIRTIKPETIADSIFSLLGIEIKLNFKTLNIGSNYHIELTEVVPNFVAELSDKKDKNIYIRADLHFDDQKIAYWCANYKSTIISNKMLPLNLVHQFSANINTIFFKLTDEDIPAEYFYQLKNTKVKFIICTKDKKNLAQIRNKYFDFVVEYDDIEDRTSNCNKINAKFLTNKVLLSEGKVYPSEAHLKINKSIDSDNEVIYDDNDFWKDSEHYYLYE